ncbi:MAG: xylulokinase [Steroidobacteraceae bacterium]
MSLFIGVDSGTQSVKALVLDMDEGRVVARASAPHALIAGLPARHVEQHPQTWIAALGSVIHKIASKIERARVRGIGIAGQQHGFVPLDARGEVIRPAKLWCDTSTVRESEWLNRKLGGRTAVIRRIGLPFLPGYTAPKILWLKRQEPRHFRRLRHVLLPHDYLNFYLTGRYSMECGDASGTALMDVRRRRWSPAAIAAIDKNLMDWLPPMMESHESAGMLRPDLARRFRLPQDIVVSAGGGDNMMAAIGTGNVHPGVVTLSLGTSGTVFGFSDRPVIDARGEVAAFCDSTGGWLPLVCTMNVTLVTEKFRRLFGWTHEMFERAVSAAPAGAGGLTLTPYFVGERTPDLPLATGSLHGLTLQTLERAYLARAAVEGVSKGLGFGLGRLSALGLEPREIRLTGGGARSAVWRQIMADIFDVPVVKITEDECAALGAALQAAWCVGKRADPRASIADCVKQAVTLDEQTRCAPAKLRP